MQKVVRQLQRQGLGRKERLARTHQNNDFFHFDK